MTNEENVKIIPLSELPAGEMDYNKLSDTIIIFICTFDLFGQQRYVYEFEYRCKQDPSLRLNDGCRKVYLNTQEKNDDEVRPELIEFLHMLECQQVLEFDSPKVRDIYNRAQKVKKDSQVEARYMRELVYEKELIDKGYERGVECGIECGIEQERRNLIEKKLAKGQTIEQIAQALEMDNKEIEKIIKDMDR